nr:hypothetical protein [Tanacetum cinerariifolium]
MGEDSEIPTNSHRIPTVTQPSTYSQPQQKQNSKKSKKRITEVPQLSKSTHDVVDEHVTTTSNDPLSGEDRLKLTELIELCTQLQSRVLALETTKANQALEIKSLKTRVKKLEKKASKTTHKIKRLYKIDEGVALVDETQGRNDQDMFDTSIFDDEEVVAEKEVSTAEVVPTGDEVVTTASVEVSTAAITSQISMDDITLAKALIDIKISKPMTKGIVIQEPSETSTQTLIDSSQQSSKAKDKGKAKMIKPKKPLKKKDQIMIDKEVAINLEAQMQADWKKKRGLLQEEERGELTIEEKSRLFVDLMDKRKKHFERLKAKQIISKPPTKAQKKNQMCTYLKNMANYKHNQLKNKIFEEIKMLFNNTMKWIDSFVPMDIELVKGSKKAVEGNEKAKEGSSKRAANKLEQEDAKRQRIEEENESAKLKRCLEIIPKNDDDVKIKATPLSSKSPTIVDYKIYKEGRESFFKIIRVDVPSQHQSDLDRDITPVVSLFHCGSNFQDILLGILNQLGSYSRSGQQTWVKTQLVCQPIMDDDDEVPKLVVVESLKPPLRKDINPKKILTDEEGKGGEECRTGSLSTQDTYLRSELIDEEPKIVDAKDSDEVITPSDESETTLKKHE